MLLFYAPFEGLHKKICNLVNEGSQMARFLKVSQGLDNYTAIRVWAEKWLKQYYPVSDDDALLNDLKSDEGLYPKLKTKFSSHFPSHVWKPPQ